MKFETVLTELAQLWGVNIPTESDAIEIIDNQECLWVLECSKMSDTFTLYTHLNISLNANDINYWLSMNMKRDLLGSSWIGLDEGTLCLGLSLPKDKLDHHELNNIFENMLLIKEKLYLLAASDADAHIDQALINIQFI
ncbi:hypothetical protein FM037_17305 [Shewanella psychropiezotolerans]|uniref:Uncharacterized protein n=1 Tax=Shewanella psychropiezotolerans TaxID=2593655 RepID=A0ABX5X5W4_9GAMM|nr:MULTISPECIES: CesT family type III secretion system chaperone [Shewanella]MPY21768.1 hypothetical protein [Shewanella sp. YLB-07]QDO84651.1 hypothetical protein FM037_17305 [Shewanella psychropiezotolerans]